MYIGKDLTNDYPTIVQHFNESKIDYSIEYIKLYIVYNRWYRFVTGETNDRIALQKLKKRYGIWLEYTQGKALFSLRPVMAQLVELTQRENDWLATKFWSGYIQNSNDWRSLIELWYQVRCKLVHGSAVKSHYVQLSHSSLTIFLEEIIGRINRNKPNQLYDDWGVDMHPGASQQFIQ